MSEYFPNAITFQKDHVSALKEMSPVLLESQKPARTMLAVFQSKETLDCYKRMTHRLQSHGMPLCIILSLTITVQNFGKKNKFLFLRRYSFI
jgi:hypothetical protein